MIEEVVIAKMLDMGISLFEAGLERQTIVDKVADMESKGAKPDEITDALQAMRKQAEGDAQAEINKLT